MLFFLGIKLVVLWIVTPDDIGGIAKLLTPESLFSAHSFNLLYSFIQSVSLCSLMLCAL